MSDCRSRAFCAILDSVDIRHTSYASPSVGWYYTARSLRIGSSCEDGQPGSVNVLVTHVLAIPTVCRAELIWLELKMESHSGTSRTRDASQITDAKNTRNGVWAITFKHGDGQGRRSTRVRWEAGYLSYRVFLDAFGKKSRAETVLIRARARLRQARANRDLAKTREAGAEEQLARLRVDLAHQESTVQAMRDQRSSAQQMVDSYRDEYLELKLLLCTTEEREENDLAGTEDNRTTDEYAEDTVSEERGDVIMYFTFVDRTPEFCVMRDDKEIDGEL
ncbi:hypothetical protein BD410DRAFT_802344 [Rickenella mellea]|uniref:Uncharacterized protein n=1 Tax=Rickenella mellea TaxID=50990 RepID=A0A4Y7Q9A6_9AGAM|nr:hypothetical protein BD410DRAFT_802344 [Rickenella mellea]